MRKNIYVLFLTFLFMSEGMFYKSMAQCSSVNLAFKGGETLHYELYFNWKFIWFKVGSALWKTDNVHYKGKQCFLSKLITKGAPRTDRFFVMRDTLISIVTDDIVPLFYEKAAKEGKDYRLEKVWYDYPSGLCQLKMLFRKNNGANERRDFSSKYCAYDMLSMMLRARSFNGDSFRKGQRRPFLMAEGKRAAFKYFIYRGKKNVTLDDLSITYRCLVFSYVEKEKGKEKEIIRFYVSDDKNHLPVRLDMYLRFGTAKAYLTGASGVRNKQTSIVK